MRSILKYDVAFEVVLLTFMLIGLFLFQVGTSEIKW